MAKPLTGKQWVKRLYAQLAANEKHLKQSPHDRDEILASTERTKDQLRQMGEKV